MVFSSHYRERPSNTSTGLGVAWVGLVAAYLDNKPHRRWGHHRRSAFWCHLLRLLHVPHDGLLQLPLLGLAFPYDLSLNPSDRTASCPPLSSRSS